jgi:cysteine desulfuration protein SufE
MKDNLKAELDSLASLENEYLFDYLLDEGKMVPDMPDEFKSYHNEIQGCQSRVWLIAEQTGTVWNFAIDSDAFIVKGIGKLVTTAFNGSTSEECLDIKFADFGLISRFLTGQRQRGLQSIINAIHKQVR